MRELTRPTSIDLTATMASIRVIHVSTPTPMFGTLEHVIKAQ